MLLTVRQAAERLSVSRSLIYGLVASGRLRACRIGNGRGCIRFTEEQIREFIESSQPAPKPPPVAPQKPAFKHVVIPRS
jgi:excisionase family DNA binding protein